MNKNTTFGVFELCRLGVVAAWMGMAGSAWGQDNALQALPAASAAANPLAVAGLDAAAEQRIAQLVTQLGAPSFALREQASAELLACGEAALVPLRSVPQAASFEIRHRAQLIQRRIEDEKFSRLSRSFLLDLDAQNSYGLPAWNQYRSIVGATRTSKLLFLDMIREQPEIAQLIELASGPQPSRAALSSLETLAAIEAVRLRESLFSLREPKTGDAVAMLLVAATLPTQTPVEISEIIVSNERRSFSGNIAKEGYGSCLRKLMAAWIPKMHAAMAPIAMDYALRYDLSEGAPIARQHLTPNFDSDTRKLAFYCLAKFGNETDVERLLPLLDDRSVVDEFARSAIENGIHESNTAPPGTPSDQVLGNNMVVRINDLALTTAMLLLGEDPTTVFPRYESHGQLVFFIHSLATPAESADEQQARIDQWRRLHLPKRIES